MHEPAFLGALKKQFGEAFDVLAAAVGAFEPEQWAKGGPPYVGAGRAAAHALVCAEFYTCRERAALDHFGQPVWQMADEDVPDQDAQAAYLEECRAQTMGWIDGFAAEGLAATDEDGATGLERIVYALRHLQHHTGEVFAWQKSMGIPVRGWE
jgi:hypothetical protein